MGLTWRSVCSFTLASMPSCAILKDAIDNSGVAHCMHCAAVNFVHCLACPQASL